MCCQLHPEAPEVLGCLCKVAENDFIFEKDELEIMIDGNFSKRNDVSVLTFPNDQGGVALNIYILRMPD